MKDKQNSSNISSEVSNIIDPAIILQAAIDQIEVFTMPDAASLEVEKNGRLVSVRANGLERIVGLARNFIAPVFSGQVRRNQETKLNQIKQELLQARDIIQSHSLLIEKLKEGDSTQQKLAQSVVEAIKRYNAVVIEDPEHTGWTSKYDFYNYERNRLLLDEEIKGKEIRLPHTISIKCDSFSDNRIAQKTIKQLSNILFFDSKKDLTVITPTHKKSRQVMLDAFRMKAIRSIKESLQSHSMSEIIELVKEAPVEVDDRTRPDFMAVRQVIEISPGSLITLSGSFKKIGSDSRLMSVPILEEFHSGLQFIQTGFPYPSQYAAWALADQFVNADPLRSEQVPLFGLLEKRKKKVALGLLFDRGLMSKAKRRFKQDRDVFNQNIDKMITLHRELIETIIEQSSLKICSSTEEKKESELQPDTGLILDRFYDFVKSDCSSGLGESSPFDKLALVQLQVINLAIVRPVQRLQEEWLNGLPSLRTGTYQEKLRIAIHILRSEGEKSLESVVDSNNLNLQNESIYPFICLMSNVLGQANRSIIVQYMSEKIGFAPGMLTDFEQKIQACAFGQLITFLNESEEEEGNNNRESCLESKFRADLAVFKSDTIDSLIGVPQVELVQELEVYFNSRFYANNFRK